MANRQAFPIAWLRCRGRNGFDSPLDVPEDMGTEVLNMHFEEGGLGTKRGGSTAQAIGGDSYTGHNALFRFVPGQDDTAAELFIVDNTATKKILRVAAGTSASNLTLADTIDSLAMDVNTAAINGKLYFAYDSDENRLHVFDPGYSTTEVRRAGLETPAAATVANTGAGTYTATLRYYRIQWLDIRSSVIVRGSNLGAAVSFTPSGTGTHARVTRPTAPGEGETHWIVFGSADGVSYFSVSSTIAIATTTFDDNTAPSSYSSGDPAPTEGLYTPFPSVKYLATDGTTMAGFGVWESATGDSIAPKAGTLYFTDPLDTTDTHDDERISNTTDAIGRIAVSRNSNAEDRGLANFENSYWAFQSRGIYQFVPTGNSDVPFRRVVRSRQLGLLRHQTLVEAQDEYGLPALYFLDPEKGPYRYGRNGFQWCGKDVRDVWQTVNLAASNATAFGLSYPALNLVLFWVATGASNDPDTIIAVDTTEMRATVFEKGSATDVRYGWMKWTGTFAAARCGVTFSSSMGATMGRSLVPYVGLASGTTLLRYNPSATDDNSTDFQAYVVSGAKRLEPLPENKSVVRSYLLAEAASGVTITQSLIRNFGDETARTDTVLLTAAGSESRVLRKFEASALTDAYTFQVQLGDAAAGDAAWTLEEWHGQLEQKADR